MHIKHRRTVRWKNFDYSREGSYFITLNTKDKFPFFGNIQNEFMCLSTAGQIVYNEWLNTLNLRDNVSIGEFVVMPDHFHSILLIDIQLCEQRIENENGDVYENKFGPQINNLSSIIRGFKASCTKQIISSGVSDFSWQTRFYDRVIRDYEELLRIENYIINNISRYQTQS